MKRFSVKPTVYFSDTAMHSLQGIRGNRALIVTDPFLEQSGMLAKVTDAIVHIPEVQVYTGIKPDPDVKIISEAVQVYMALEPDVIIAYGGGSTIDAAKSMLYFIRELKPEMRRDDIYFVAIPTTSGTGSEVTRFSVITAGDSKIPIVDDSLLPDVAILDASFTASLPPKMVAETGLDVLTHALEAYVSKTASYCTDALAEKSAELVFKYLEQAMNHEEQARSAMHHASCIAGMAFTNAGLGINHSLAHALGGHFHMPHGLANALFMPLVIDYNSRRSAEAAERYAALARYAGLQPFGTEDGVRKLVYGIKALTKTLQVPKQVRALEIDRDTYFSNIPQMAEQALHDTCTATNPVQPTLEDLCDLYKQIY